MSVLDRFREMNESFPKTAQILEHKSRGGKVIGWLCTYVPEEIIHASGALPIRIIGYSHEANLDDANAHLYINNCTFSRSCLQLGLEGQYDFLDGVVGGSTCDGARRLFDVWRQYVGTPFHHVLTVPRKFTERAHTLYYDEVVLFKKHFEEHFGVEITDEALLKSAIVLNESRGLLHSLYELRKRDKPPISGAETLEVLNAAYRMPKETFNLWLSEFIEELKASDKAFSGRARVMLVGSVLTNPEFIKSIEDQGALVVTDELCTSTRYWGDKVALDDGRPILETISRRYLNNFPCARMYPSDERFNRIIDYARAFKVDGVISEIVRYCVPYAHDLPLLSDKLSENGIPTLALDVEYGTAGSGQIATRVQAFLEMLEARKR
ncbi:MAG: 2-hydroxyacyl-CoA dehydratase family protein [Dehalococcoidia bacterium]